MRRATFETGLSHGSLMFRASHWRSEALRVRFPSAAQKHISKSAIKA